ncbi:hypothetical protein ABTY98_21765 [Streptomyces sp. NPDC096040]|uniref:hypothetical protein n=1 Tax=Streptomyces sp. NPDC096040 TaxID=3155541 RepID=UPI0033341D3F
MNGYELAAVVVVCVTVLVVVLLWAMVRLGQQSAKAGGAAAGGEGLSAGEEFAAVQAHNRADRAPLGVQIAEAASRAAREKRGEW